MAEFFRFLKQNRPDIGLVDNYDLSEIYDRDERFALSNLFLDPDGLDQIYKLSAGGVTAEDIRTVGGLDKPVIHSLAISEETLSSVSFDLSRRVTTDKSIGDPGLHSYDSASRSDNIIVFHGGIAANKIEYDFLDETGQRKSTTVSTSRESLFSSESNTAGEYTSASYTGLFRIRRRSHVNEIRLNPNLLSPKSEVITESPTHLLTIPVYMSTALNPEPASPTLLKSYVTKNSPIILPVRISDRGTVTISRNTATSNSPAFVYGWELKLESTGQIVRSAAIDSAARRDITITINVAGTVGNNTNCLLYIYLDPSAVTKLSLRGMGMQEVAGKDLGLVGFNNLEELDLSSNRLSTIPVWVKTLDNKLKVLNISGNSYWNDGIISYFDWQEPPTGVAGASSNGSGTFTKTLVQVMSYSGFSNSGAISGYDGEYSTVADTSGNLYKDLRKTGAVTVDAANGFRTFNLVQELNLGATIKVVNPDFSKIFPSLKSLVIDSSGQEPQVVFGLIPKLRNNNQQMSINLRRQGNGAGSLRYLGDNISYDTADTNDAKAQFIGQFKFTNFNIFSDGEPSISNSWFGGICTTDADITSGALSGATVNSLYKYSFVSDASATTAWSGWLDNLGYFDSRWRDVAFKLAQSDDLYWTKLETLLIDYCNTTGTVNKYFYNVGVTSGGVSTDIVRAPLLRSINAYASGWAGKIFSISDAPALTTMQIGANDWDGYPGSAGEEYILPTNFVSPITGNSSSRLQNLYLNELRNGSSKNLEFRTDDLENIPKLRELRLTDSYITGKFPTIYNTPNTLVSGVSVSLAFRNCRFRDLNAMGSSTDRVSSIWGPGNGTGVGGSLLPNFTITGSGTNSRLGYINLAGNLNTNYPSGWSVSTQRNKPIEALITSTAETTSVAEATWTSRNNNNTANATSDKLYQSNSGGFSINTKVMVGDIVLNGSTEIGRVTQIDRNNAYIYVNNPVSLSAATLSFRRAGQEIGSSYLDNYTGLSQVYLQNNRIVGDLPLFENCFNLTWVYFNNNLISNYNSNTLQNITGMATGRRSTPRLRRLDVSSNPLSAEAVRRVIQDAFAVAVYYFQLNVRPAITINLASTKYDSATGSFVNWTREEILTTPELETAFNQLGAGNTYSGVSVLLS